MNGSSQALKNLLDGPLPSLGLLLLLGAGFAAAAPDFLAPGNLVNILRQASPLMIASLGQMLVVLVAGVDISTGALVAMCSVSGALAAASAGTGAGVFVAIGAGGLAGAASGIAVGVFRVQPVIATIGMLSTARGFAFLFSGGLPVQDLPPDFIVLGNGTIAGVPVPLIIALGVLTVVGWWLSMTRSGRALFAIGGAEDAALAAGIAVRFWRASAYCAAGALAGLAAVIYSARSASGQSTFGYGLELETIAAVVLGGTALGGGRATVIGTAIGALIVTVLANGMDLSGVSPYVQRVVLGAAIVIIVLLDLLRRRWMKSRAERVRAARRHSPTVAAHS